MKKRSKPISLDRLKDGNKRFASDRPVYERHDADARAKLVAGQKPYAAVLSCADSRVVPELAFDAGLGELFVVRVAGNVANDESVGSLEYAVAHLGVKQIIVLGHQNCGAVGAALGGGDNGRYLNNLLAHLQPAVAKPSGKDDAAKLRNAVKKNARLTAKALADLSPKILGRKTVTITPAYYSLETGKVAFL